VTEENDLDRVEQMLRSVPPPIDVPGHLEAHARAAALGEDVIRPVERSVRMRRGQARFRLLPAAAVLATAVVASLVLGVGGRSPGMRVITTVPLSAPVGSASGSVQLGAAHGAMRPIVLRVSNLPAAPNGYYYEMWFGDGAKKMALLPFNTSGGRATVVSEIPADVTWRTCWVSLENYADSAERGPVLRSLSTT
jgi:hypothetical protein